MPRSVKMAPPVWPWWPAAARVWGGRRCRASSTPGSRWWPWCAANSWKDGNGAVAPSGADGRSWSLCFMHVIVDCVAITYVRDACARRTCAAANFHPLCASFLSPTSFASCLLCSPPVLAPLRTSPDRSSRMAEMQATTEREARQKVVDDASQASKIEGRKKNCEGRGRV